MISIPQMDWFLTPWGPKKVILNEYWHQNISFHLLYLPGMYRPSPVAAVWIISANEAVRTLVSCLPRLPATE